MNVIQTVDLITLSNISKSLKQKDFIVFNNKIYGIDSTQYHIYTSIIQLNGINEPIQLNYKELSEFVKSITTEMEFNIENYGSYYNITNNLGGTLKILKPNILLMQFVNNTNNYINNFSRRVDYGIINNDLEQLLSMKKSDGTFYYKKDNKYFMTLYPGLLPVNKGDKINLSILDNEQDNLFVGHFEINKKNIVVNINILYLKLESSTFV